MTDQTLSKSLLLVVALLVLVPSMRAQTEVEQLCINKEPTIGEYRNLRHGFSIIIPPGLKGNWTSIGCDFAANDCICKTDDGRRIPLAIDAAIEITAFFDPVDFEFFPPNAEHNEMLRLRQMKHVSQVKRLRSGWFRLSEVDAHRYAIQFRRGKQMFTHDSILVLYKQVVYELSLHTMAKRYVTDKKLFEEIIASWRWTQRTQ